MGKQPGAVDFKVTSETGETRTMTVYVENTAPESAEPYPVLYYKMDGADLVAGAPLFTVLPPAPSRTTAATALTCCTAA